MLQAPDGTQFIAKWIANDIEGGKRVGLFDYPLIDGTVAQDLGLKGFTYPLTLYFEGASHDIDSFNFIHALSQKGPWNVIHPLYGSLTLQPLSPFTLKADPTASGNVTIVESSWMEPVVVQGMLMSTSELGAGIISQATTANASAAEQFANGLGVNTAPDAMASAMTAGQAALGAFTSSPLQALCQTSAEISAALSQANAAALAALITTPLDIVNATSNIQAIMNAPALVEATISSVISAYVTCAASIIAMIVPASDSASQNAAVTNELFLSGAITGIALSVANTLPATRDQALQAIKDTLALFISITTALDGVQTASAGNTAATQYFSNGISFPDLVRLVGLTCAYLLRIIFDLKIAKRFTLATPRAVLDIVIQEYGTEYQADGVTSNYDLFIATNTLRGQDVIILPAGREVVVYV